jgi:hypothetical protein
MQLADDDVNNAANIINVVNVNDANDSDNAKANDNRSRKKKDHDKMR